MDTKNVFKDGHLNLPANMSREIWDSIGKALAEVKVGYQWHFGDWMLFGMGKFGADLPFEAKRLGVTKAQLFIYKGVASRFSPDMRKIKLPWTHYRVVAWIDDVPKRMALLKQAKKEKLAASSLRDLMMDRSTPTKYSVLLRWVKPIGKETDS